MFWMNGIAKRRNLRQNDKLFQINGDEKRHRNVAEASAKSCKRNEKEAKEIRIQRS